MYMSSCPNTPQNMYQPQSPDPSTTRDTPSVSSAVSDSINRYHIFDTVSPIHNTYISFQKSSSLIKWHDLDAHFYLFLTYIKVLFFGLPRNALHVCPTKS
ncbi:unnamed protein product, partial [Timema podura]|nr:unnamed protein product [Timema podura]